MAGYSFNIFLWKALHNKLSVGEDLSKQHVAIENVCCLCGELNETTEHIFLKHHFARTIWFGSSLSFLIGNSNTDSSLGGNFG